MSSRVRCHLCSRSYATKGSLKRHIAVVHERSGKYRCKKCDKKFYAKYQLKNHMEKCGQLIRKNEFYYQRILERYYDAKHSDCTIGQVDLLNEWMLGEIKSYDGFHHALGQLICYRYYFPGRINIIFLFGKRPSADVLRDMRKIAVQNNMIVIEL